MSSITPLDTKSIPRKLYADELKGDVSTPQLKSLKKISEEEDGNWRTQSVRRNAGPAKDTLHSMNAPNKKGSPSASRGSTHSEEEFIVIYSKKERKGTQ